MHATTHAQPSYTHGAGEVARQVGMHMSTAYRIVRHVAAHGAGGYMPVTVNTARLLVRADIAERQARRARATGARWKAHARRRELPPTSGLWFANPERVARYAEKRSRAQYRAASQYTRVATLAREAAALVDC